jgi:putative membrane protein insertion efficiency factor
MKSLLLALLTLYRWIVSPMLHALMPGGCKFHPTCSQYATEAIEIHGAARGGLLAFRRLLRCHPFTRGGFDPVPMAHSSEIQTSSAPSLRCGAPSHNPLP